MKKLTQRYPSKGIALFLFCIMLLLAGGCMNVRGSETIGETSMSKEQFAKKTIAALPVKEQSALSTDSLLSLKVAINEKLDDKLKEKLPDSRIIDTKTSVDILNDKGKLGLLDDLIKTYESTGVFDKRMVDSLCSVLHSDYIVFSRLKAEKMAVAILGKGFGASLEVLIISKSQNQIVWGGSGEFKRGGIFGMGTTQNKSAADELIRLAFLKF